MIIQGLKTVESRSPDPKNPAKHYWKIKPGEIIKFVLVDENYRRIPGIGALRFWVTYVSKYSSVREMLIAEGLEEVLPGVKSIEEGIDFIYSFPGYQERTKKYGIFAFGIEPVEKSGR